MKLTANAKFATLLDVLRYRASDASDTANNTAFVFLKDGEQVSESLSFRELDQKVRSLACRLQALTRPGDRVLLVYPPGLEFIIAFFGCVYAGVVAVPAILPVSFQSSERLQLIANDSQAALVLTVGYVVEKMITPAIEANPSLSALRWLASDSPVSAQIEWVRPKLAPTDIAFLQYTSGSTRHPRGVMVTHSNILANAGLMRTHFPLTSDDTAVSWLPHYHDMGLIGKIIYPLFCGSKCVQFPARVFLMRPYRWLKLISEFRARITAAPNFAFDLCTKRVTAVQKQSLDLSTLEFALNGSEFVRAGTLHRFSEAFEKCGFRRGAMVPVYGLAEATLFVSANRSLEPTQLPATLAVSKRELGTDKVCGPSDEADTLEVVSVGAPISYGQDVMIVDPMTLLRKRDGTVGEILVRGPSVAKGYWNQPAENQHAFTEGIADKTGVWLRTGDLGFIHNNQLFITGRIKEMMIFNGRNVYPQDVEATVERIDPAFRINGCAAFALEKDNCAQLAIVQEIEAGKTPFGEGLLNKILAELAKQHELFDIAAILFVKAGQIPRTSSGKIQRNRSRDLFMKDEFTPTWSWRKKIPSLMHEEQHEMHNVE